MATIAQLAKRGRALLVHPGIGGEVEKCCERDGIAEFSWAQLKRGLTEIFVEIEGASRRRTEPDAGPLNSTF